MLDHAEIKETLENPKVEISFNIQGYNKSSSE